MVEKEKESLAMLLKEAGEASPGEEGIDPLGYGLCRASLRGLPEEALCALHGMFVYTANTHQGAKEEYRRDALSFLGGCLEKKAPFAYDKALSFWRRHQESGLPAMHHSEQYRRLYRPCYRVIGQRLWPLLDLCSEIERLRQQKKRVVIAVEGDAASGKSTLAQILQGICQGAVVHMDDFFLPAALRTQQRLEEPGGNVDYQRFCQEVGQGLAQKGPFAYRRYDCQAQAFAKKRVEIPDAEVVVVEGAYSLHPTFPPLYDLKVFVEAAPALQKTRILKRNGEELWQAFETQWIPMEKRYFQTFSIKAQCGYVFEATAEGWQKA